MLRSLIIGGFLFFLCACSKDAEEPPTQLPYSYFNTPVTNTGYYAYDINGSLIRVIGLPNTFREITINNARYSMRTFPNPRWYGRFSLAQGGNWFVDLSSEFEGRTGKAYLVRANGSSESSEIISENGTYFQNTGEPFIVWEGSYEDRRIIVPTPADRDADYRLYVEIEGKLIYDNLAVRQFSTY